MIFNEEEATAIWANYGQVRNYLDKKKLGRGYHRLANRRLDNTASLVHVSPARSKEAPTSRDEHIALGEFCCSSRSRYNNRSGFSPMQRVFGFTTRLPNSLLSDDPIDPSYLSTDPLTDFTRAEKLRQAATRAWAAQDSRQRLLHSLRARHRTPQTFAEGQLVFV